MEDVAGKRVGYERLVMSQVSGPGMTAKGGFLALCREEFKSEP